ncbi:MAG: hypothetical protein ACK4HE_10585 [Chitinophagaceae bacterium]
MLRCTSHIHSSYCIGYTYLPMASKCQWYRWLGGSSQWYTHRRYLFGCKYSHIKCNQHKRLLLQGINYQWCMCYHLRSGTAYY